MWNFDRRTIERLVGIVCPDAAEAARICTSAEREPELLASILQEPRLHSWLLERPHELVSMAPQAFFASLLYRVRGDLATRTFTHERASGRLVVVFDVKDVRALLELDAVIAYLSWVLASFVRIHSVTRTIRIRESVWRKITVSDYDIRSMLGYVQRLEPKRRPVIYRRIGEVALFQNGVFSEDADTVDLVVIGTDSYTRALDGGGVLPEELDAIEAVRDGFVPATKAFRFMSDHYLAALRTKVFTTKGRPHD